jgi:hypothetical protein
MNKYEYGALIGRELIGETKVLGRKHSFTASTNQAWTALESEVRLRSEKRLLKAYSMTWPKISLQLPFICIKAVFGQGAHKIWIQL